MKINTKKMKNQNLYRVMSKEDVITSVTETRSGLKTIWSSLHPSFDIEKIIFSDHQINYGDDLDQIYNCNELNFVFEGLRTSESKGKFINKYVLSSYKYKRA